MPRRPDRAPIQSHQKANEVLGIIKAMPGHRKVIREISAKERKWASTEATKIVGDREAVEAMLLATRLYAHCDGLAEGIAQGHAQNNQALSDAHVEITRLREAVSARPKDINASKEEP